VTKEVVDQVNEKMQELLRSEGIEFKFIKYCPHRPEELCGCRKPATGLGLQAIGEFKIDLNRSFMIGDMDSDVIFGHAIGLKSVQLITGEATESSADFVASDILAAAEWIFKESRKEK
jgi:D-glycero-D-manno-heptose 1,7-bisphosphate phosphatase